MPRITENSKNIDKALGAKVDELRLAYGWSSQYFANKIGVTHQQCRKYFRGTNCISPSRLVTIAHVFGKPVAYFFENIENPIMLPTQHQRMCIEVSRNFLKIKNPLHQNAVNALVRTLSENQ